MTELRNAPPPPEIIVPLRCECGNRDDTGMIAPPCSAGCGRRMVMDGLTEEDKQDLKTVLQFVYGWWPGLEDGITGWGSDELLDQEPPIVAARRLAKNVPWLGLKP